MGKNLLTLLSFLICILSINSKPNELDMTKAMSCMTIIAQTINQNTKMDSQTYSTKLLSCFLTIKEEEAKEFLVANEQGINAFEPGDVERLTSVNNLRSFQQEELRKKSLELDQAIKDFRRLQQNYKKRNKGKTSDDDDEFRRPAPSNGNAFGAFMKKLTGFFKLVNNMGSFVLIIIFGYFFLILVKQYYPNDKKNNKKEKEKEKDNKSKKENKKKNK